MNSQRSQEVLSTQLNSIIEMTQVDAGETVLSPRGFWLAPFLEDIVEEFKLLARQKNITLKVRLVGCYVYYDAILLARVVRNLISNVLQHCPNATLLIALRKRAGRIDLCFIDNGPGIPEKDQKHIYSEFFQLNNPERDRNKGMGLGLAIVKRLVELLNVSIELKSQPSKGTCFRLGLTWQDRKAETKGLLESLEREAHKVVSMASNETSLFIIVVDDDADILEAMRSVLKMWHHEVLLAPSLSILMEQLNQDSYPVPDLLMVDYRLAENKTGVEVVSQVRTFFNQNVPAVIISGDTTLGLETLVDIEGTEVFYKPISEQTLKTILSLL